MKEQPEQELSQATLDFLATCKAILDSIERDIYDVAVQQSRELPMPGAHFVYGRMSINTHLWEDSGSLMRMLKDNEYTNIDAEVTLSYLLKRMIRYEVYRLAHTPNADMLLRSPHDETERINTLPSIPAISAFKITQVPPAPPTVPLTTLTEETDVPSGGTDILKSLAHGQDTEKTGEHPPVRSKRGATT